MLRKPGQMQSFTDIADRCHRHVRPCRADTVDLFFLTYPADRFFIYRIDLIYFICNGKAGYSPGMLATIVYNPSFFAVFMSGT